jgi:hypothetical protein
MVGRIDHPGSAGSITIEERALALWPRLDPVALRRCRRDPRRIAALVARRTSLPPETIHAMLVMPAVTQEEATTWFG